MATPLDNLEQQLSAYLDGELSAVDTRDVERILRESPAARRSLERLRSVSRGLSALAKAQVPMPLDAWTREIPTDRVAAASPVRRTVIRLFTRLSAAAALIVIGMFAAWMLPPRGEAVRVAEDTLPANGTSTTNETRMRASVRELGYAGTGGGAAQPSVAVESEAPAVGGEALAKVEAAAPLGDSVAGMFLAEPDASRYAMSAAPSSPVVNLVVVPQSANQYRVARAATAAWESGNAIALANELRLGAELSKPASRQEDSAMFFSYQAPPTSIMSLVRSLDDQLGDTAQVRIQMDFPAEQLEEARSILGGAWSSGEQADRESEIAQRLSPSEPPVASKDSTRPAAGRVDADESAEQLDRTVGGRGLVGRDGVGEVAPAPAEAKSETRNSLGAGRSAEPRERAEKQKRAEADTKGDDLDPADEKKRDASAREVERGSRGAGRFGAPAQPDAAAPTRGQPTGAPPPPGRPPGAKEDELLDRLTQPAASAPATQNSVTALMDQVRDTASTLGDRIDNVLRFALARLEEEGRRATAERAATSQSPAGNVRLNVTILPPQPAAAPASQPAAPR